MLSEATFGSLRIGRRLEPSRKVGFLRSTRSQRVGKRSIVSTIEFVISPGF